MITITPAAHVHIQKIMQRNPGAIGFRLAVKETGCSGLMYVPEVVKVANPEDVPIVADDIQVYVPKESIDSLKGTVIDLKDKGLGQQQLVFNNPNAESLCGCGESFNLKKKDHE